MIHPVLLSSVQDERGAPTHSSGIIHAKSVQGAVKYSTDGLAPGWWCQNFHPLWKPLVYWIRRQRHMTLSEFQLLTSRIPELPAIEKTILISVFVAYKNMQS
ncbi:MAG: hypothetical protein JNL29_16320 [Nitrospira sp.]|nr:hypothetical protein [Nitrospira sp.]